MQSIIKSELIKFKGSKLIYITTVLQLIPIVLVFLFTPLILNILLLKQVGANTIRQFICFLTL